MFIGIFTAPIVYRGLPIRFDLMCTVLSSWDTNRAFLPTKLLLFFESLQSLAWLFCNQCFSILNLSYRSKKAPTKYPQSLVFPIISSFWELDYRWMKIDQLSRNIENVFAFPGYRCSILPIRVRFARKHTIINKHLIRNNWTIFWNFKTTSRFSSISHIMDISIMIFSIDNKKKICRIGSSYSNTSLWPKRFSWNPNKQNRKNSDCVKFHYIIYPFLTLTKVNKTLLTKFSF